MFSNLLLLICISILCISLYSYSQYKYEYTTKKMKIISETPSNKQLDKYYQTEFSELKHKIFIKDKINELNTVNNIF